MEIVRSNIRFSLQPVDAPPDPATLNRLFDHMQSDELLLFSTDYPHWPVRRRCRAAGRNVAGACAQDHDRQPHATYSRLKSAATQEMTP